MKVPSRAGRWLRMLVLREGDRGAQLQVGRDGSFVDSGKPIRRRRPIARNLTKSASQRLAMAGSGKRLRSCT